MDANVLCLGYNCSCGSMVVVYRFRRFDGCWRPNKFPEDAVTVCQGCGSAKMIRITEIQSLIRWEEADRDRR